MIKRAGGDGIRTFQDTTDIGPRTALPDSLCADSDSGFADVNTVPAVIFPDMRHLGVKKASYMPQSSVSPTVAQ